MTQLTRATNGEAAINNPASFCDDSCCRFSTKSSRTQIPREALIATLTPFAKVLDHWVQLFANVNEKNLHPLHGKMLRYGNEYILN